MFYLTHKFHDHSVNTFGFMEGELLKQPLPPPPQGQELRKSPGGIGLRTLKNTLDVALVINLMINYRFILDIINVQ